MDMGIIARILGQGGGPAYVNPLIDRGFANSGASHNRMLGRYGQALPPSPGPNAMPRNMGTMVGVPNPTPRPQGILGRVMQQQGAPASPQPPQPTQPQPGGQGILGRMQGFMGDNRMALMGMGAGILNNGLAGGPGGAFQGSQLDYARGQDEMARNDMMAERDRETQEQTRRREAMIQMAVQNGLSPEMAQQYEAAGLLDGYLEQALAPEERRDPVRVGQNDILVDPVTGQEIARGSGAETGALEQQRELVAARGPTQDAIRLAQSISDSDYLGAATGVIDGSLPPLGNPINAFRDLLSFRRPFSTAQGVADLRGEVERLGGQAFMQAREALRGGGQITDFEGRQAERALANLSTTQSPEAFQRELRAFQTHVARGFLLLNNVEPTPQAVDAFINQMTQGDAASGGSQNDPLGLR